MTTTERHQAILKQLQEKGRVCNLNAVQSIITDNGAPVEELKTLEERRTKVIVAD